jgi:pyridoxal biosynthesis lyase PdxS
MVASLHGVRGGRKKVDQAKIASEFLATANRILEDVPAKIASEFYVPLFSGDLEKVQDFQCIPPN